MGKINLIKELKDIYGKNLVSVILYGENLEQDTENIEFKQNLDQNIIALFEKLDASELKNAIPFIKKWRKTKKSLPVVMSEKEWFCSADIYPVEYTEIKNGYQILYGKNVVEPVKISKPYLRLQCEYEIKNLLVKIRQIYLGNSDNHKFMVKILEETSINLIRILKSALSLFDISVPEDYSEIIQKISEQVEFDGEIFIEILSAKENKRKLAPNKLEKMVDRAINSMDLLYKYIDDLEIGV